MKYFNIDFILALKLALVPSLIGGVTLAGRRWGSGVAGWLSAFPIVAGPILLFIAIEKGAHFAQAAAASTLSAVLAIVVFGLSYSWAAVNHSWVISLQHHIGIPCGILCRRGDTVSVTKISTTALNTFYHRNCRKRKKSP
jgi:hypothetical protein